MYKIPEFLPVNYGIEEYNKEARSKVAFDNMKQADECYNLKLLEASAIGWFRVNKNKTPKDLEILFRQYNFNTFIIPTSTSFSRYISLNGIPRMYICVFDNKNFTNDVSSIYIESDTYQSNLQKLENTGFIEFDAPNDDDNYDVTLEELYLEKLRTNTIRLVYKTISGKNLVNKMIYEILQEEGVLPEQKIYKYSKSKNQITYGLYINNILVCDYGFIELFNDKYKIVKLL